MQNLVRKLIVALGMLGFRKNSNERPKISADKLIASPGAVRARRQLYQQHDSQYAGLTPPKLHARLQSLPCRRSVHPASSKATLLRMRAPCFGLLREQSVFATEQ